jgi:co-chaperonin GroES (HSP10)
MKDNVPNVYCVNGVVLIQPIDESTKINYGTAKGRIGLGKVICTGGPIANKDGSQKFAYCEAGDTVYFLTYEAGYDRVVIDGQEYIFALFDDLRGVVG